MKFSGKIRLDKTKCHKKAGLYPLSRRQIFGKTKNLIPPLLGFPHFLKFSIPPPYQQIGHPKFSLSKQMQINTVHVKQQHTVDFFIFKFTLKYMVGNVYINKIHARQCLYISLYSREGFSHPLNFLLYPKESYSSNFKTARRKRFFNG